ncbi:hypothetical protein JRO89_XSUnG0216100 [Xanthoceras sorbifolium]|uniref:Uncharacterized protein n=1 Tax=Xanthoceras sorbifolium TaxID=99658 RepID=A0ABQ8GWZ8_9ROSI|nr:hypothetical protein JRO89_XSUnG0216100 [Xanthoceras sorbifolium]
MAAITKSLERSLQNCSLNNHRRNGGGVGAGISLEEDIGRSSSSDDNNLQSTDTALELNSHVSLPYHWEQCLDLKTGEIYYINWRNGMKAKEDPRTTAESSGDFYSEEDDNSSYDSEESSSESSPSSSTTRDHYSNNNINPHHNHNYNYNHHHRVGENNNNNNNVLVVAGCKSCLMYFMVPKQVEDCPKCNGQLLHFDRSDTNASSP